MGKTIFLLYILSSCCFYTLIGQSEPQVFNSATPLKYPWAGGMNSMQFGEIDIDLDGKMDLFALDRDGVFNIAQNDVRGNRTYCFLNDGGPNEIKYVFAPEYSSLFPELYNWVIFADYNMDGKTDIFTYSPGWAGIKVYENVSTDVLKFDLVVSPFLTSFQGGGYTNIFVTYADYPGIYDIDNDGDLDLLTFSTLGTFVDLHRNMSMELYGIPDSLSFERTETCWGYFGESEESNKLNLDTCRNTTDLNPIIEKDRHTGSTFLLLDLNADNLVDLLLGDIDYPSLFALYNGGSPEEAIMTSYDTLFPATSEKTTLFSMPVSSYIDVNNDGLKDLLVSTFDPSLSKSQNKNSVWLYLNYGDNNKPIFNLYSKNFLQKEMLDFGTEAHICVYDLDKDDLNDLIIGNYGYYLSSYYDAAHFLHSIFRSRIDFYKNTGTTQKPKYQLWKKDIGNFWVEDMLGLAPALADINADSLPDILAGNSNGRVVLSINKGNYDFEISDTNYFNIDVGEYSYPQLFDLDKDGLKDLIIGEKNGNINYYHNEGNAQSPDFVFITDSLGKINVTDYNVSYYGYSSPHFFRLADGATKLIVGSEQGLIHYYEDIDNNLGGEFMLSDKLDQVLDTSNVSFDRGLRTSAAIADLNKDGKAEMLVGNYAGGIEYFGVGAEIMPGWKENKSLDSISIFPNPANNILQLNANNQIKIHKIKIYSLSGILVMEENFTDVNSSVSISLKLHLQDGFYFIQVYSTEGIFTKKLIFNLN
ncbi:MAG: T9SS type A sorting domain-containing protein [Chlorobi bacterium]|nr:T9SS type A sorting domain-containing protein [Chlorobiota bacterium]